jgi:hypothetical protein
MKLGLGDLPCSTCSVLWVAADGTAIPEGCYKAICDNITHNPVRDGLRMRPPVLQYIAKVDNSNNR